MSVDVPGETRRDETQPRAGKRAFVLAGEIAAIVSSLVGVAGVVFVLAPGLKPDPAPVTREATFDSVVAEPNVTRAEYLQRLDRSDGSYTKEELQRRGVLVSFNVTMTGHKGERLPLRWALYDANSGRQIYKEMATTLMPEAVTDQASLQVWTPLPTGRRPFYVLLQLFEADRDVTINHARTPTFTAGEDAVPSATEPG